MAFDRILASSASDLVKLTAAELIERVTNPLLRRIANQRTGAMAGGIIGGGVAAIILAFFVPFL